MSSKTLHLEFGDKTRHQVNTDELIATLPGDTIGEKVTRYVTEVLRPEFQDINSTVTSKEGIEVSTQDIQKIQSLRNKLIGAILLQRTETNIPEKQSIQKELEPILESVALLYSSMLVAYCHSEIDELNKLKEKFWQEVESRHYGTSHFHRLIDGAKNIETIARGLSRKNIRESILEQCASIRAAYKQITAYNDDYRNRRARHQD